MELESLSVPADFALEHPAPYITRHGTVMAVPAKESRIVATNPQGRAVAGVHCGGEDELTYHVP